MADAADHLTGGAPKPHVSPSSSAPTRPSGRVRRQRDAAVTRRAALWFVAVAVLSSVAAGAHLTAGGDVDAPPALVVRLPPDDTDMSVLFLGDTMLGDAVQPLVDAHGYTWPFEHVRPLIDADFTIANLETAITTVTEPWDAAQRWSYNSQPPAAAGLAAAGVRGLGLANNHAFDRGPQGLVDTMAHARRAGLVTFGAGPSINEAERPLLLQTGIGTIAVVAFAETSSDRAADETQAGSLDLDPSAVRRGVDLARRAGADWVVAFVHWGENYKAVEGRQRAWAHRLVEAGYDLVVGHGPHVVQPVEFIGHTPVAYSIGNFVFGAPGRFARHQQPGYGLMLTAHASNRDPGRLTLRCILTDNAVVNFQPRPCDAPTAQALLTSLNPGVVVEGDTGVLRCRCFA